MPSVRHGYGYSSLWHSVATLFIVATFLLLARTALANPSITARAWPAPNAAGWNNTTVTVSFLCEGTTSCPEPVVLDEEGRALLVTRTVADENGRQTTIRHVVNIDRTAPQVFISTPQDRAEVEQSSVSVSASATDTGSAVVAATCNGTPARIQGIAIFCAMTLYEGANDVIVQAMDAAGNSGSIGVQILRRGTGEQILIAPNQATLPRGGEQALHLTDSLGRAVTGARWLVSNPLMAAIRDGGDHVVVKGLGPGTATITASWGQSSAQAILTVAPQRILPEGTTKWSVAPREGFGTEELIYTSDRGASPEDPFVFVAERERATGRVALKAVAATPALLWVEAPAIRADERIVKTMGDSFGGALLRVDGQGPRPSAIVRVGRPSEGSLWRYESAGKLTEGFAQAGDGLCLSPRSSARISSRWSGWTARLELCSFGGPCRDRRVLATSPMDWPQPRRS